MAESLKNHSSELLEEAKRLDEDLTGTHTHTHTHTHSGLTIVGQILLSLLKNLNPV